MAIRSTPARKAWRSLIWLLVIIAVLVGIQGAGVAFAGWGWGPKLALDLEGGTQIIMSPVLAEGQSVTREQLDQAVGIIRQRVDAAGIAESEVRTEGIDKIVVLIPGEPDQATLERIQASAKLEFRAVLIAGQPSAQSIDDGETDPDTEGEPDGESPDPAESPAPTDSPTPDPTATPSASPTDGSDLNWITPELQAEYNAFDCASLSTAETNVAPADLPLITCEADGSIKYLLGPVEVAGETISNANSGPAQGPGGITTGGFVVNIEFNAEGTEQFAAVTTRLVALQGARNQFGIVLDGRVISAPRTIAAITNGQPQITGDFTQEEAKILADQLRYGALPIGFQVESRDTISATLGESQLNSGILAGIIGLLLVVAYSFFQYRALASVTIASLVVVGLITFLVISIMSWRWGYRLSLAGVAGLIVAIGFTVDSFIVYFERIRDELRDGRGLVGAVEAGWKRALRTIYAAKGVSMLSAVVLMILAVGSVRGFAITLGVTVVIDVLIVIMFTHPVLQLLATTRFFSSGHPLSGVDPQALGAVYRGRAEFRFSTEARRAGASREAERRQTIAERKAAELVAADASTARSTAPARGSNDLTVPGPSATPEPSDTASASTARSGAGPRSPQPRRKPSAKKRKGR